MLRGGTGEDILWYEDRFYLFLWLAYLTTSANLRLTYACYMFIASPILPNATYEQTLRLSLLYRLSLMYSSLY